MDFLKPFDQAEELREDIVNQVNDAERKAEAVYVLFERLVALLRQLGELGKKLRATNEQGAAETAELTKELEETRTRLSALLKRFPSELLPPGKKDSREAPAIARSIEVGAWTLQQRLTAGEKEREEAKQSLDDANKEAEQERARLEGLMKLKKDAESLLKRILPSSKAESLEELVPELRDQLNKERRTNAASKKKLETCLKVQKEVKAELDDVGQVLRQLFGKCAEIEQAVSQMRMKGSGPAPSYREDVEDSELFDQALKWLLDVANATITELRDTKNRLADNEQKQKDLDSSAKENAEGVKRLMSAISEASSKIQGMEMRLRAENVACEAAMERAEERRKMYESQLDQLKGVCKDEKTRAEKMVEMLKPMSEDLNTALSRLKQECKQAIEKNAELAQMIEKVLQELKLLQDRGSEDQIEKERSKRLNQDEEDLRRRLQDARNKLKEANEKRRAAIDELRGLKKKVDDVIEDGQRMEELFNPLRDDLLKTETEIIRTQMEIERLREKVSISDRTLETREQMLKDLQDRKADMEKEVRRLEKENEHLRWQIQSGDEGDACSKCEDSPDLAREAEMLQNEREALKAEIETLQRRLNDENAEMAGLGSMSSSVDEPLRVGPPKFHSEATKNVSEVSVMGTGRPSPPGTEGSKTGTEEGDETVNVNVNVDNATESNVKVNVNVDVNDDDDS